MGQRSHAKFILRAPPTRNFFAELVFVKPPRKMAAPGVDPGTFSPPERDLARSEEEEKLLKQIREEKDRLWFEIQVNEKFTCTPVPVATYRSYM